MTVTKCIQQISNVVNQIYLHFKQSLACTWNGSNCKSLCCYFRIERDDLQRIKSRCKCLFRIKLRHQFISIKTSIFIFFMILSFHTFSYFKHLFTSFCTFVLFVLSVDKIIFDQMQNKFETDANCQV